MKERLNKYIARCGVSSRRKADKLIVGGRVKVDGITLTDMGVFIDPEINRVEVNGNIITPSPGYIYYALYKPVGYVSTVEDPHVEKKVIDLVPSSIRVFPVGRLDKNSEGLMVLTNDGELANLLTHPRYNHEKEYRVYATVNSPISWAGIKRKLNLFKKGIMLRDGKTRPAYCFTEEMEENMIIFRLIIKEGKKRQIRRMCKKVGLKVERLIRIRIEELLLGDLKPGEYRIITRESIISHSR